jgi:hypothetical protein
MKGYINIDLPYSNILLPQNAERHEINAERNLKKSLVLLLLYNLAKEDTLGGIK